MTRLIVAAGLALALSSTALGQQDLTGIWTGSFSPIRDGVAQPERAHVVLKQTGNTLTGTAGPTADTQFPILKGQVEGNKVTFEVQSDAPLIVFELTFVDGHLKGRARAELNGQSMMAEVDLERRPKSVGSVPRE